MNTIKAMSLALILTVVCLGLVSFLIYDTTTNAPKVEVYTAYGIYYLDFGTLTATCETSDIKREFTSHTDMTDWLAYITARDVNISEVLPAKAFIDEPMSLLDEDSLLVLKTVGSRTNGDTIKLIRDTLGYLLIDDNGYHFHACETFYQ